MRKLAITFFAGLIALAAGSAIAAPTLRPTVNVTGPVVTIGDFYTEAGDLAQTPIFRSPDLGTTGNVSALIIAQQAQAAGFIQADTNGLTTVSVHRLSIPVDEVLITDILRNAFAERASVQPDEIEISFSSPLPVNLQADANAISPLTIGHINWTPRTARFKAILNVVQEGQSKPISVIGNASQMVSITTLARNLDRGAIITANDVRQERKPASRYAGREFLAAADLIGMEVRRNMRSGSTITPRDVSTPVLVKRGAKVTVLYKIPGMNISTQGKAKSEGGKNDLIEILNPTSKKTILAEVIGKNIAVVTTSNTQVAAVLGNR
ncbi:flagellar basal body P-ring biosynthesis protein FlgA [Pseudovibrio sp. FO-BEG1]|uniref:flagellar basal body P-ring formation chaperone FlgA n=1 Tax=unclassified Pseudovibrio TaxID=2627060 RepID=UPI000186C3F0|nr:MULTISPECIES: flagellar basal body P-ring formation chaperone FlgA [unclassified Pseudovibrio]AEV38595.1 flagellar basal body P-ring biosynthesis protein FlgA [Pseudovibrio sp. FO-BEG1]EEA95631.1 flageller protein FlgA, putative [Pseudovibrio sp. JE062]